MIVAVPSFVVHAFYPVFKFTVALGQFLYDFIRAARDIATDCGSKLYALTDVKFVGWHGSFQRKPNRMYHGKMRSGDGYAKKLRGGLSCDLGVDS
jgi:hypothetical protein